MRDEASHKTALIRVRCTPAEKALFETAAAAEELTLSEYVRQAAAEKAKNELDLQLGLEGPTERIRREAQDDEDDVLAEPGRKEFSFD